LKRRFRADRFLIYWQSFTNTYAPVEALKQAYGEALRSDPRIVGMTVGTRPDCVENEKLELLQRLSQETYVCLELGLESIYSQTLATVNRCHDTACFRDAVSRTRQHGLDVCAHIILGFPNESRPMLLEYPAFLNELGVDFVKIHHLHIVRGTELARRYTRRPFPLFSLGEWTQLVCDVIERLHPAITIQRLFGWVAEEELLGPVWSKTRAEITREISQELECRDSWQGKALGLGWDSAREIWETQGAVTPAISQS
jgi:radical SAM protein (TIGR01212 family)